MAALLSIIEILERSKMNRETKIINYISGLKKTINKLKNTKASEDLIRRWEDNLDYYIEGLTDVLGKKKVNKILDKVTLKIQWEYVHLLERELWEGGYPEGWEKIKGVEK
jgi:hypothetical protein